MDKLKSNMAYSLLFLLGLFPCIIKADQAKEITRLKLLLLLQERPDLAERFLRTIEGKKLQPTPQKQPDRKQPVRKKPTAPSKPVQKPIQPPQAPILPEKVVTPKPIEKALITEGELNSINKIFSILETNAKNILSCLKAFFCKTNCQPYQQHVGCLKSHINYLNSNLVQQFPQAETAERQKVFGEFRKISTTLEKAETALLKVIDQQYGNGMLAAGRLGKNFLSTKPQLEALKKEANASINLLKRDIPNMQRQLEALRTHINNMFDFGKDMGIEIMGIITHRLSR